MYLQKVICKKTLKLKIFFCCRLDGQDQEPDPGPLVRGMDPRIRIHTKMSRIRNAAKSVERARKDSGSTKSQLGKLLLTETSEKMRSRSWPFSAEGHLINREL
jgi:hypothetical protein